MNKLSNTSKGDKTERVLFGTDAPLGIFGEKYMKRDNSYGENIEIIRNAVTESFGERAKNLIDKIFFKNSEKVFNIEG